MAKGHMLVIQVTLIKSYIVYVRFWTVGKTENAQRYRFR